MSEKKEKVYPKGVRIFEPRDGAPEFVAGEMVIGLDELNEFAKGEGAEYLTEYKGKKQLRLQLLNGNNGLYSVVNTWKPKKDEDEDLPF